MAIRGESAEWTLCIAVMASSDILCEDVDATALDIYPMCQQPEGEPLCW